MKAEPLVALRYMTRFRCTGAECIDTCCAGWNVLVDEEHYVQLRRVLGTTPTDAAHFDARVPLMAPEVRKRHSHATFAMREGGNCPFLNAGRLCAIQETHGADLLPNTCAEYPRMLNEVGERSERSGYPSCPEAARLMLFESDATDRIEVTPATLGLERRPVWSARVESSDVVLADLLRDALYGLVSRDDYPIRSRLFFLSAVALRLAPLFGAERLDLPTLRARLAELEKS